MRFALYLWCLVWSSIDIWVIFWVKLSLCRLKRMNFEMRNRGWKKQKTTLNKKWRRSILNQLSCLTLLQFPLHFLPQTRPLGASWYLWLDILEYPCGSLCLRVPSIPRKTTFSGRQSPKLANFFHSPALLETWGFLRWFCWTDSVLLSVKFSRLDWLSICFVGEVPAGQNQWWSSEKTVFTNSGNLTSFFFFSERDLVIVFLWRKSLFYKRTNILSSGQIWRACHAWDELLLCPS